MARVKRDNTEVSFSSAANDKGIVAAVETASASDSEPAQAQKMVRILSKRPGPVEVAGGIVIRFDEIKDVPVDVADELIRSHGELMRII